mgnify:CR=1 FL=1
MPTINDRIGSQNVIRVLSNASAPPTRIVNLTDVNTARSNEDGMLLVWDLSQEAFYMSDVLDAYGYQFTGGPDASGITTFSGTTNSISVTTGSVTFAGGIGVGKNLNLGGQLAVTGISTFSNTVDVNADVDILRGLNVAGISSVQSLSIGSTQVISSARELQNITSLDATTTATIEAAIKVAPNTFTDLKITGISTFIGIATFGGGIAVQAGVSTFSALVDVNNRLDVVGGANVDQLNLTGISTFASAVDINAGLDVDGQADLDEVVVAGVATFSNTVDIDGAIDADGGANIVGGLTLDQLNVTGVSTFGDDVSFTAGGLDVTGIITATQLDIGTGGVDIDGETQLDELVVAGVATFSALADVNNRLDVTGGANIDQLNVTGISSFTQLDVSTGGLDVDGQTDLDEVVVTGVSTFQSDVVIVGDSANVQWDRSQNSLEFSDSGYATFGDGRDLQIYHDSFNSYLDNNTGTLYLRSVSGTGGGIYLDPTSTSRGLVVSPNGAVEAYWNNLKRFETSGIGITVTGQLDSTTLNVSGVSTFSALVDANARLDVTGGANIDQLNVAGIATFGAVDINGVLDIDGQLDVDELVVAGVSTFSSAVDINAGANIVGGLTLDQLNVTGVSTFGDDSIITAGGLDVTGIVTATELDVSTGGLDVDGQTNLDELVVAGVSTFSAAIDANVGANIVGGLTLDELNVTGVSTFSAAGTIIGGGGMDVTGIITATELDIGTGGLDVDGQTDLDELVVAGIATFTTDVNITGLLTAGAIEGGSF